MTGKYYGNAPALFYDPVSVEVYSSITLGPQAYSRSHILRAPANFTITLPPSQEKTAGHRLTVAHGSNSGTSVILAQGTNTIEAQGPIVVSDKAIRVEPNRMFTLEDTGKGTFIIHDDGNLQPETDWSIYAPIFSPTLTGDPEAPTAPVLDSDLSIANVEHLLDELERAGFLTMLSTPLINDANASTELSASGVVSDTSTGLPASSDPSGYLFHKLYNNAGFQLYQPVAENSLLWRRRLANSWQAWTGLTNLDSPDIQGTPRTPTAPYGTRDKQLASTEFARNESFRLRVGTVTLDEDQILNSQKADWQGTLQYQSGTGNVFWSGEEDGQEVDLFLEGTVTNIYAPRRLLPNAGYILRIHYTAENQRITWSGNTWPGVANESGWTWEFGAEGQPALSGINGAVDVLSFHAWSNPSALPNYNGGKMVFMGIKRGFHQ